MTLGHTAGGHWIVEVIWVMPVLVVVVWISIRALIDRRRARAEPRHEQEPPA